MANQEHFDILKQGVEMWNQWRGEHTNIEPDLCEADLRRAHPTGADLSNANLWGDNLSRTYLVRAHLDGADLSGHVMLHERSHFLGKFTRGSLCF